ncbi:MAG: DUF3597 domain-containing protein [Methylobacterium mesophilicum]|nr:DUF3597 domain-containing protein [Methylobacterium mesophilicum]
MSIFSKIKDRIWGHEEAKAATTAAQSAPTVQPGAQQPQTASAGASTPSPASPSSASPAAPAGGVAQPAQVDRPTQTAQASTPASGSPAPAPASGQVDVAAVLDAAVKKKGQKLDWKHSIVDLMKALDLESDLASRKQLAEELHYTGDKNDSATMNVWLNKALLKKLAENGGKVPAELTD